MNAHLFVSCFESKHALLLQMKKYILDKLYKSLFGDIVVLITAAALNVIVVVIEMKNDKLTKTEIKRQEGDCNLKRVFVFKTGEHYDAIVPETRSISENVPETRSISENAGSNVALATDDKNAVKSLRNPLEFSAAQLKNKSSNNDDKDELNTRFLQFYWHTCVHWCNPNDVTRLFN